MTFIYDKLSKSSKKINDIFAELISLVFLSFLLFISLKLLWLQWDYIVGGMGIPYYIYYGPIALTAALLLPCVLNDLINAIRSFSETNDQRE